MPEMLKAGTEGLKDARSGGHLAAAGGLINTEDLEKFKQQIRDYLEK